jgi:hypothetical protein
MVLLEVHGYHKNAARKSHMTLGAFEEELINSVKPGADLLDQFSPFLIFIYYAILTS